MKYPKITEAPICNHSPYLLFFFFWALEGRLQILRKKGNYSFFWISTQKKFPH